MFSHIKACLSTLNHAKGVDLITFVVKTQIGGVQTVTLGDQEARSRNSKKSILERKAPPTFPFVIEMRERHYWITHRVSFSYIRILFSYLRPVYIHSV